MNHKYSNRTISTRWASCLPGLLTMTVFVGLFPSLVKAAPLSLSQAPAVTTFKNIAPNLIFMLDDSGSMQFEYLGNILPAYNQTGGHAYGFPPGYQKVYGAGGFGNNVPSFSATDLNAAQYRNSFINPNYYNPSVTYTPWACPASYPESQGAPPTGALGSNGMPSSTLVTNAANSSSLTNGCQWDSSVGQWLWPDANPHLAYQNPDDTTKGFRSLDVWNDSTNTSADTPNNGYVTTSGNWWNPTVNSFWPATYFDYFGVHSATSSDISNIANYQRVQICPPNLSANSNGNVGSCSPPPTLPANPSKYRTYVNSNGDYVYITGGGVQVVRSYSEEIQNFANWYQYYRSHALMARAGASQAFMQLPDGFRVDFATLNHMAQSGATPQYKTVETFDTSRRGDFLEYLYGVAMSGSTPSRLAVAGVGNWLSQAPGTSAPWGASSAENSATGQSYLSCRQNYLVFATDGGWNGSYNSTIAQDNPDGTTGGKITGPDNQSYTYKPGSPYNNYDSSSNAPYSLANVAMYYWKHDLQTGSGMPNDVPSNGQDPAFWQHMTMYAVGLGVNGTLTASDWSGLQSGSVNWPTLNCWTGSNCSGNEAQQIDDLWHAAVDGHGSYLSAADPSEFAKGLADQLISIQKLVSSSSSVSVNTQKGQEVKTETQVYQPVYHPQNWWGELLAQPIVINSTTNEPEVSSSPAWNASCVLTGATSNTTACPTAGSSSFTAPNGRQILTWNDSSNMGVPFELSDLSSTQQTDLGSSPVLDYLRGVRSDEIGNTGGTLRARTSVLGDIVDSSPVWVGYPNRSYPSTSGQPSTWSDSLYPSKTMPENSGSNTYQSFATNEQTRENMVYVGANDGFLHAFRAGHYALQNGQLTYQSSDNDGRELLAYMPSAVFSSIKDYTDKSYTHKFFADATPGTGDLFYNGKWHTWLVSGLGGGGKDLFALDITKPSNFSQSNASSLVAADWNASNLSCANVSNCADDLGYTYGVPLIRRFHNGDWGVIWGNGLNSSNGTAGIFIGLINHATGAWTVYYLGTGYGPSNDPNGQSRDDGITYTSSADLDDDHVVDYIYAGDYFGNVWRFNVTSSNPADWHVSTYGSGSSKPLFSAVNSSGTAQPITTQLQLVRVPDSSTNRMRLLIAFGTGSSILTSDQQADTSAGGVQSLYGVWDWDMNNWNNGYTTASGVTVPSASVQYASLSTPQAVGRSSLQPQTITAELDSSGQTYAGTGIGSRIVSNNSICWKGSTAACPTGNVQNAYGWYMDLVSPRTSLPYSGRQGEKVVYSPTVENGVFVVNTSIIPANIGLTCDPQSDAGWTMSIDPATGGRLGFSVFYNQSGQLIQFTLNNKNVPTSGITYGAVGTPSFIVYNGQKYMVVSTAAGKTKLVKVNLGGGITSGRMTWVELR